MSSSSSSLLFWFFESTKQNTRPTLLLISFLEDTDKLNLIQTNKLLNENCFLFPIQKKISSNKLILLQTNKQVEIRKTRLKITNLTVHLQDFDLFIKYYDSFTSYYSSSITTLHLKFLGSEKLVNSSLFYLLQQNFIHLQVLDLSGNPFSNTQVLLLCELIKSKQKTLVRLVINLCYMGYEAFVPLYEVLNTTSTNLNSLELAYNFIGDKGMILLSNLLETNTALTFINLSNNEITSVGINTFFTNMARRENNNSLTGIDLSWNSIGSEEIQALSINLQKNTTLKSLNLYSTQIKEKESLVLFESLKMNSTLTCLNLGYNPIGKQGLFSLSEILKTNGTGLTSLNLSRIDIQIEELYLLTESLEINKTLTELSLSNTNTDNLSMKEGIILLSNMLKLNHTLLNLNLCCNNIRKDDLLILSETLKYHNSSLLYLDLSCNNLKNGGITEIVDMLLINTSLKKVYLQNNIFDFSLLIYFFTSNTNCSNLSERIIYYDQEEEL